MSAGGACSSIVMFIVFIAGFMLEPLVIILMVVPITVPLIEAAGFDKVWFCVLFLVMLQTGYLTPPMAPSIFYLRGIAPPEITLRHMYIGIWPFIGLQLVVVGLLVAFPEVRHVAAGCGADRLPLGGNGKSARLYSRQGCQKQSYLVCLHDFRRLPGAVGQGPTKIHASKKPRRASV